MCGVIIINKEDGLTSQGVVNRVKRILGVKKAGHTGTLDPMATGVLPVLLERGVKASEFMLTSDKHYGATLLLGVTTDTEDVTGEILSRCDRIPTESEVRGAVNKFIGKYMQTPPMYSALKIGGKKLCDLARAGISVDREPREVTVHSIGVSHISDTEYFLDVCCSKGTYIRTLCADVGKELGVGGVMKTLVRTEASGYTLDDANTFEKIEAMSDSERAELIRPVEEIFKKFPSVSLGEFFFRLASSGLEIYQKKIGTGFDIGEKVSMYYGGRFFAVGEVREYENGTAIKPIRQF